jgi:hypothetical protein
VCGPSLTHGSKVDQAEGLAVGVDHWHTVRAVPRGASRHRGSLHWPLDGGHDVQRPVDLAVARPRQTMPLVVTGGCIEGAVPFQEAKCARVGNRVMSPTSTSSLAAPEGPMPCRSISVLPSR